jgi:hypothetical protein
MSRDAGFSRGRQSRVVGCLHPRFHHHCHHPHCCCECRHGLRRLVPYFNLFTVSRSHKHSVQSTLCARQVVERGSTVTRWEETRPTATRTPQPPPAGSDKVHTAHRLQAPRLQQCPRIDCVLPERVLMQLASWCVLNNENLQAKRWPAELAALSLS